MKMSNISDTEEVVGWPVSQYRPKQTNLVEGIKSTTSSPNKLISTNTKGSRTRIEGEGLLRLKYKERWMK